jgi:hypothetical protein
MELLELNLPSESLLKPHEIRLLLKGKPIVDLPPWNEGAPYHAATQFYKNLVAEIASRTHSVVETRYDAASVEYSSYIEALFFRKHRDFLLHSAPNIGEEYAALQVLMSRFSPYYSFMESSRVFTVRGSSITILPQLEMIDNLHHPEITRLASQIQPLLEERGLIRAYRENLQEYLESGLKVPTWLTDDGFYTQFDALFQLDD